jgi:hypothetical protein
MPFIKIIFFENYSPSKLYKISKIRSHSHLSSISNIATIQIERSLIFVFFSFIIT